MTFKKNGTDPEYNPAPFIGLRWVGQVAVALGLVPDPNVQRKAEIAYRHGGRSRRSPTPRKKHRNMLIVSKRVRRKHRRAAA